MALRLTWIFQGRVDDKIHAIINALGLALKLSLKNVEDLACDM
jgi:hypothetical protein